MKNLLTILLSFTTVLASSQGWENVGQYGATDGERILAAEAYQGNLVVGGQFEEMDSVEMFYVAMLQGNTWTAMGTGFDDDVYDLEIYDGDLYAAGKFEKDEPGDIEFEGGIAKWNGSSWDSIAPENTIGVVYGMDVISGSMYITHNYEGEHVVTVYDGSSWTTWSHDVIGPQYYEFLFTVGSYDGDFYVGGIFDSVDNIAADHLFKTDGTSASSAGIPGVGRDTNGYLYGRIRATIEYDGKLWVGGIMKGFPNAGYSPAVAHFDGTDWNEAPLDMNTSTEVFDFEIHDGDLFIAGDIEHWDGPDYSAGVCKYDPTDSTGWVNLGFYNSNSSNLEVFDIVFLNDTLYAVGRFDAVGDNGANTQGVVKIDAASLPGGSGGGGGGTGVQELSRSIQVYPNPASQTVMIEGINLREADVQVHDIKGTLINVKSASNVLDVSTMSNGVYFLSVKTESTSETVKIMVAP